MLLSRLCIFLSIYKQHIILFPLGWTSVGVRGEEGIGTGGTEKDRWREGKRERQRIERV